jgi:hypothetical protein
VNPFEDVMEKNGVRFARIRSPQKNNVRVLSLEIRVRAATRTEYRRQTDDARGVSSSVAAIDVVRAENRSRQLCRQIIHLIRRARAAENPERVGPVLVDDAPETGCGSV